MWTHLFSYRLRCLLRDWQTLLWTLLFPIALGTLFYVCLLYTSIPTDGVTAAAAQGPSRPAPRR